MEQTQREMEGPDSLALSDVILPSQFFGGMGGGGLCSEQRLMLAVLVDAINILQGWNRMGNARKRRAFAEAARVCDALGIDPEVLRVRLGGLTLGHGTADRLGAGRLRLKESSRAQHMTANRVRRRRGQRVPAIAS